MNFEDLNIDNLGLNFSEFKEGDNQAFGFGPSKKNLKSMNGWEGFDGKLFKPYRINEKVNHVSDFVQVAIQ